ncbi:hypothetical protein GCM10010174_61440 [Kutzneria viridogrisea]
MLRFLARLPAHSEYKAALADDEEYARLTTGLEPVRAHMTMAGYDPVVSRLDTVIDVLISAHSTGTNTPTMPRPVTARDRLAARSARSRHLARVTMLRGHDHPG